MSLRYPNIRLIMHNRLLSTGDCVGVFAELARELGLSCPPDLSDLRQAELSSCGALAAAQEILRITAPTIAEAVGKQLLAKVEEYKLQSKRVDCGSERTGLDCSGMAPIIIDLLLQLLETYPESEWMSKTT